MVDRRVRHVIAVERGDLAGAVRDQRRGARRRGGGTGGLLAMSERWSDTNS